ncbi:MULTISPECIES: LacI family DNA-binding transcriptional regulator [Thermotoga]|uniref:Transcriptional regulator, LacI family n=1 Tax=Thermotoga neapolitana (strain ATCC 49049 / DSM 4359 / NBRC 107923 / NS-E) TaxID=309803 RepID=B9K996_THENN|nr:MULTISPECIES: LacI family DNA-binding transcriptional regulator [Thermotoga]ACM23529.1 Transcriptional regulator, LacI family [Thermotoga neapolitana DSM 4359]AJG41431.1 LacI family transcriptional regulator [Thermotoga sp. RQ7]KFZ21158.1 Transcriptional regulator, LacI family protein [Thermotoga neapolitana LA10]HBF10192.1 LacI family transcriptional regulator [Thermotoga neapolitana]
MASIRDVARLAGVSIATVSRVINGYNNVSEETRKKVIDAIRKLNYHPIYAVKNAVLKRTIGVLVPDFGGFHYNEILTGIEKEAIKRDFTLMISTTLHRTSVELERLEVFFAKRVDGIIVCSSKKDEEQLERLIKSAIPVVVVDREEPEIRLDNVGIDNYAAGRMCAKYLLSKGHKKVLLLKGRKDIYSFSDRERGFIDYSTRHGIDVKITPCGYLPEHGYHAVERYLRKQGIDFTAIFAINDLSAVGALKALHDLGVAVPDEISIMGFDDDPISNYTIPALTTVRQPREEMGRVAFEILHERLLGKKGVARRVILPVEIIERESVKQL